MSSSSQVTSTQYVLSQELRDNVEDLNESVRRDELFAQLVPLAQTLYNKNATSGELLQACQQLLRKIEENALDIDELMSSGNLHDQDREYTDAVNNNADAIDGDGDDNEDEDDDCTASENVSRKKKSNINNARILDANLTEDALLAFVDALRHAAGADALSNSLLEALLEKVVCANVCALSHAAPRTLVGALERLVNAHERSSTAALLVPLFAAGSASSVELAGRLCKSELNDQACNRLLSLWLARADARVAWTAHAFGALQTLLERKTFELSADNADALVRTLHTLAPTHGSSERKFAALMYRFVQLYAANATDAQRAQLVATAEQCNNFLGRAALKKL